MKKALINLYSIMELSERSRNRAIEEHRDFLCNIDEADKDSTDKEIIESIEANNYLFFTDGELAACCEYCGKYPKAGITELRFKNEIYIVTE